MGDHQSGGLNVGIGPRERELHTLILADGPRENHALFGVTASTLQEPAAVANALRGDQNALGVETVQQIAEPLTFLADQVLRGYLHSVKENFRGGMIHHSADGTDGETVPRSLAQIDQQDGETLRALLHLLERRGACDQQHQIRMLGARYPDLLSFHDIFVTLSNGQGLDLRGIRAGGGLAYAESL